MARYRKFHSKYSLEQKHQTLTNGDTIWEKDWSTVRGPIIGNFGANAKRKYTDGNFTFVTTNIPSPEKKHTIANEGDVFTYDQVSDAVRTETINNKLPEFNSNDLRDYAYFGSAYELVRTSIENIVKNFPPKMYTDHNYLNITPLPGDYNHDVEYAINDKKQPYYVLNNPFKVDFLTQHPVIEDGENPLHYMSTAYPFFKVVTYKDGKADCEYNIDSYEIELVGDKIGDCVEEPKPTEPEPAALVLDGIVHYPTPVMNIVAMGAHTDYSAAFDDSGSPLLMIGEPGQKYVPVINWNIQDMLLPGIEDVVGATWAKKVDGFKIKYNTSPTQTDYIDAYTHIYSSYSKAYGCFAIGGVGSQYTLPKYSSSDPSLSFNLTRIPTKGHLLGINKDIIAIITITPNPKFPNFSWDFHLGTSSEEYDNAWYRGLPNRKLYIDGDEMYAITRFTPREFILFDADGNALDSGERLPVGPNIYYTLFDTGESAYGYATAGIRPSTEDDLSYVRKSGTYKSKMYIENDDNASWFIYVNGTKITATLPLSECNANNIYYDTTTKTFSSSIVTNVDSRLLYTIPNGVTLVIEGDESGKIFTAGEQLNIAYWSECKFKSK